MVDNNKNLYSRGGRPRPPAAPQARSAYKPYHCPASTKLHTRGAPGSSRPTGLVVIFTFINQITYMQGSTALPGASPRPTLVRLNHMGFLQRRGALRNAEDSVPYRTWFNHIRLYKWQVPCRGQAPGPQASPRGTLVRLNHITLAKNPIAAQPHNNFSFLSFKS